MVHKSRGDGIGKRTYYDARLKHFNMCSLLKRREYLDLTLLHKIVNGGIQEEFILVHLNLAVPRRGNVRPSRIVTFIPKPAYLSLN